jgi:NAD(P)-dependent dehydrogenase (short-subunit alcohol dehydrogenase family)
LSTNRIALVTGAGGGIGLELVRQLQASGARVVLTARSEDKAKAGLARLASPDNVLPLALDVASDGDAERAAASIGERFGRLDLLISNAATGYDENETTLSADLASVHQTLETNLFGLWRLARAFRPLLLKSAHPRIIAVSSGSGSHDDALFGIAKGKETLPGYRVSKAGLNALVSVLAKDLRPDRILVNAVCPGLVNSHPDLWHIPEGRSVEAGARSILWAADIPDDGPTGGFFRDGERLPW